MPGTTMRASRAKEILPRRFGEAMMQPETRRGKRRI